MVLFGGAAHQTVVRGAGGVGLAVQEELYPTQHDDLLPAERRFAIPLALPPDVPPDMLQHVLGAKAKDE